MPHFFSGTWKSPSAIIQWNKFQKKKKKIKPATPIFKKKKKSVYESKLLNLNKCFGETRQKEDYDIIINRPIKIY